MNDANTVFFGAKLKLLVPTVCLFAILAATILNGCGGRTATGTQQSKTGATPTMGAGRSRAMGPGMRGRGGMMLRGSMQRHRLAMMGGLPATYRQLRNPIPSGLQVVAEGKALFQTHCIACHGVLGEGDGPAAAGLSPPPANLRWLIRRPMAWDGYLMWSISEGGSALGSAMPAYKDALSESDRWRLIRYLRTL